MSEGDTISHEVATAFGRVLRRFRTQQRLSQERVAEQSNLDRTYISLLERGKRQPSLYTILRLADVFGMSAADMIEAVESELDESRTD